MLIIPHCSYLILSETVFDDTSPELFTLIVSPLPVDSKGC